PDPRTISRLGDRAFEVLHALRRAGVDDFVSPSVISQILAIEAGRKFASSPATIRDTLQKYAGSIDKRSDGHRLVFRSTNINSVVQPTDSAKIDIDPVLAAICERFHRAASRLVRRRKGKKTITSSDE